MVAFAAALVIVPREKLVGLVIGLDWEEELRMVQDLERQEEGERGLGEAVIG